MVFTEDIKVGIQSVGANRLRSVLTALIIAIGITALVGILTCIDGVKKNINENFASMGANSFTIRNRGFNLRIGEGGERPKPYPPIKYEEAMDFKKRYQFSEIVSVSDNVSRGSTVKYEGNKTDPNVTVIGGDEDWSIASGYEISLGRNFSANELNYANNVVIIGNDIKERLFGTRDPLGEIITVGINRFKIIGVFKGKGDAIIGPGDRFCLVPISKAKQLEASESTSYTITVMAENPQSIEGTIGEAKGLLRSIRKLNTKEDDNFEITKSDAFASTMIESLKYVNLASIAIGGITLFGAAIALMNIMLVSVTERTREIGIRKSIGATPVIIRRQFLIEAIIICIFGGIAGVLLGMGAGNGLSLVIGGTFVIPWLPIIMGLAICIAVGIVSGIYPAIKASRLDPVDALRYE